MLLDNLIDQCLDADPLKRPTADELYDILNNLYFNELNINTVFYRQYKEARQINTVLNIVSSSYTTHPQAIYISRLLDYKNLPEPQNSKEQFYAEDSGDYFFCYYIFIYSKLTICILDSLDFTRIDLLKAFIFYTFFFN
jgi:hypothetical protein